MALLEMYSKDMTAHKQNICMNFYMVVLFIIAKGWKYPSV